MRVSETVVGAGFVAAGALVVAASLTFPPGEAGQPGPALFPRIVGGLLMAFGAALAVQGWRAGATGEPIAWTRALASAGFLNALAVVGAVGAYILLAERLGFLLTAAPLLFTLMTRLGVRALPAAAASALLTLAVYVLFYKLLRVPLPGGLLWF